jgi:hypothetical protein
MHTELVTALTGLELVSRRLPVNIFAGWRSRNGVVDGFN